MDEPGTVAGLRALYEARGTQACGDRDDAAAEDSPAAEGIAKGEVAGWAIARDAALKADLRPLSELRKLGELMGVLEENARLLENALGSRAVRQGRTQALGRARYLAEAARNRITRDAAAHPPVKPVVEDDLADWSRYPLVPVREVDSFHELCLFLGGDVRSFTGELLRLIAKADPQNLNRLAAGFPREVRAYLLWKASAPVPADTLVRLLEASAMLMRQETA